MSIEDQRNKAISILLQRKFGALLEWEKPKIVKTVGPFEPVYFDKYAELLASSLRICRGWLANLTDVELVRLQTPTDSNEEDVAVQWRRLLKSELQDLSGRQPVWFASGFGHPDYKADFGYWGEMPHYTRHEALCLSIGIEPVHIKDRDITDFRHAFRRGETYKSIEFFLRRQEQFERKFPTSCYHDEISPLELAGWIESLDFEVHPEALPAFKRASTPNPHDRYPTRRPESDEPKKSLDNREKVSMAKIITAMAIDGYGYDPAAKKSPIPKEVQDIAAQLGLDVTDDTIRRYLKLGAEYLPEDWKTE